MITLKIKNKGEVKKEAFTLLGASTKRGDDKTIGMFGSGNKYALAHFIKNGYQVKIFTGENEIPIGTEAVEFGEKKFDVITIDGQRTSITTETGPGWKLWQAIREIYSNAMDEGLLEFDKVDDFGNGEAGTTTIYISGDDKLLYFYNELEKYFIINRQYLFTDRFGGEILETYENNASIYHKGTRAYENEITSLFDYNLYRANINESRLFESESRIKSWIWSLILKCDIPYIIKKYLEGLNDPKLFEYNEYVNYWSESSAKPNPAWEEALKGHYICPRDYGGYVESWKTSKTYFLPYMFYKLLIKEFGKKYSALSDQIAEGGYIEQQDPMADNTIKAAKRFFEECGLDYGSTYPIVYGKIVTKDNEEKSSIMGLADQAKQTIVITDVAIEKGIQATVETIMEEYVHLKHSCGDRTRAMQDALIREHINYVKKSNSYNL